MDTYRFEFSEGADMTVKASDIPMALQVFRQHWPNLVTDIVAISLEDLA